MDPYLTRELSLPDANDRLRLAGIDGRVVEARPCAGGVANFNHELRLADGGRLLLRTYGGRGRSADESRRTELAVAPLLSALGVKAPHVVAAPDGGDFVLLEWLDGIRLRDACSEEPDGDSNVPGSKAARRCGRPTTLPPRPLRDSFSLGARITQPTPGWICTAD